MIIKEFKVPDGTYKAYQTYNQKEPELAMQQQLTRFQDVKPSSRIIIIPEKQRQDLEGLFDKYLDNAQQLVDYIKAALTIKVGGFEVTLHPDQFERLKQQAAFEGRKFEEYAAEKIAEGVRYCVDGW